MKNNTGIKKEIKSAYKKHVFFLFILPLIFILGFLYHYLNHNKEERTQVSEKVKTEKPFKISKSQSKESVKKQEKKSPESESIKITGKKTVQKTKIPVQKKEIISHEKEFERFEKLLNKNLEFQSTFDEKENPDTIEISLKDLKFEMIRIKPEKSSCLNSFYISKYELTQKIWNKIRVHNPSIFKGDNKPVHNISYEDALFFINDLNYMTGKNFRLPTCEEWEIACRSGRGTLHYWGNFTDMEETSKYCWYDKNSWKEKWVEPHAEKNGIQETGKKLPNFWNLYDMNGNVSEFTVKDYFYPSYKNRYNTSVQMGGSWQNNMEQCRSSFMVEYPSIERKIDSGIRLVLPIDPLSNILNTELRPEKYKRDVINDFKTKIIRLNSQCSLKFVWIEQGEFIMGSKKGLYNEKPVRKIKLTKGFWMSVYEISEKEFYFHNEQICNVMESFKPVTGVSYNDCTKFISKLNELEKGYFRLPTEAEWEYAARGGKKSEFFFGDDYEDIDHGEKYCIFKKKMRMSGPFERGMKLPNGFGLYDMNGNVWEWCSDWYDYYNKNDLTDPSGPEKGSEKIVRGGAWNRDLFYCRNAYRFRQPPEERFANLGFRIILEE